MSHQPPATHNPQHVTRNPLIWVIGLGKFGQAALPKLIRRFPEAHILGVDSSPDRIRQAAGSGVVTLQADGVTFVADHLSLDTDADSWPDWIIPALPRHLAAEWLVARMGSDLQRRPVPEEIDAQVPHPLRGAEGTLYASWADFQCPDDCPEPVEKCTVTGLGHPQPLYDRLASLLLPGYTAWCVRSRQLAPGLGGYQPVDLISILKKISQPGTSNNFLVATACRCHGVIDALIRPQVGVTADNQ
ncbi:MAG: potassium transporter [Deltaproteobacteria bacterium]|nr:potassium transporter [Deltaproteobacteria bacterium]